MQGVHLPRAERYAPCAMMAVEASQVTADLLRLGVEPGSLLLVHSSLSRVGRIEGGALALIGAIRDAVGPTGTLVFPALTGSMEDSPQNPPAFDNRQTACSTWIGVVPEAARTMPGAVRSTHPTHSVSAIGRMAPQLVQGHERCLDPCGEGTPYDKLRNMGGKILLLGCGHESNTSIHGVEEVAGVDYHLQSPPAVCAVVDAEGSAFQMVTRLHRWGAARRFDRYDQEWTESGLQVVGMVGHAETRLVDAARMWADLLAKLEADPKALLDEG